MKSLTMVISIIALIVAIAALFRAIGNLKN